MRKIIHAYGQLLDLALIASVAILIIPVSLQIFSRFTELIPSYIWTEEMARFFFIWMIMIGSMVGIRDAGDQRQIKQLAVGMNDLAHALP